MKQIFILLGVAVLTVTSFAQGEKKLMTSKIRT